MPGDTLPSPDARTTQGLKLPVSTMIFVAQAPVSPTEIFTTWSIQDIETTISTLESLGFTVSANAGAVYVLKDGFDTMFDSVESFNDWYNRVTRSLANTTAGS
jgi:hypothetical protein